MKNLQKFAIRDLQKESARALSVLNASNNNMARFNRQANHNSHDWYKSVIKWYIDEYGDLPSKIGPAKEIKLIYDN